MSKVKHRVGINAEPDDFAARYDRMAAGGGASWVLKTVFAVVGSLAVIALLSKLITG